MTHAGVGPVIDQRVERPVGPEAERDVVGGTERQDCERHVAAHLSPWPILLLATYRVDELTRRNPFYQQLPALVRESDGLRLDLRRLDTDALRALVATRCDLLSHDQARLVAYLERHAEGNPFFATELLRALREATPSRAAPVVVPRSRSPLPGTIKARTHTANT